MRYNHFAQTKVDSFQIILNNNKILSENKIKKLVDKAVEFIYDDPNKAIEYFNILYTICDDKGYKILKIQILKNRGIPLNTIGKGDDALKDYFEALRLCGNEHEKLKPQFFINISAVFQENKNFNSALNYLDSARVFYKKYSNQQAYAICLNNKAIIYLDQKKYSESLKNNFEALSIRLKNNYTLDIAQSYLNISDTYCEIDSLNTALIYALKAEKICDSLNNPYGLSFVYGTISKILFKKNILKESKKYALKQSNILKKTNSLALLIDNNLLLYDIELKSNNLKEALKFRNDYFKFRDSLINTDNTKKQLSTEYNYKIQFKKNEQEKLNLIAEEQLTKQKIVRNFSIVIVICLCIVIVFIYLGLKKQRNNNRIISLQKQEVEKQKEIVDEKQKEILASIKYASRIQKAMLPNEKFISQSFNRLIKKKNLLFILFFFFII